MCTGTSCPSLHKGRNLLRSMLTGGFWEVAIILSCFSPFVSLLHFGFKSLVPGSFFNADNCEDATEHVLALVFRAPNFLNLVLFEDEYFEWLSMEWHTKINLMLIVSFTLICTICNKMHRVISQKSSLNGHCVILVFLILSEYATQGEEKGSWEGSSSCQCKVSRSCCKDRRSQVRVEGFGGLMNASSGHCVVRYDISIFFQ